MVDALVHTIFEINPTLSQNRSHRGTVIESLFPCQNDEIKLCITATKPSGHFFCIIFLFYFRCFIYLFSQHFSGTHLRTDVQISTPLTVN